MHYSSYENARREIHVLAYVYHWSYFDCLDMKIKERREFVALVHEQKKAENEEATPAPDTAPTNTYKECV